MEITYLVRFQFADHQLHKGRLSCTVDANHRNTRSKGALDRDIY